MPPDRIARMRYVVDNWGDDVLEEAAELEMALAEAAADALVDAMMDSDSVPDALAQASLTPGEEELRAVHTMESEVNTGGFEQFFDNCGRLEVELAADGCVRIHAEHFETIVRDALDLVPVVPDDEWPEDLQTALGAIDERFYDAYRDIEELLCLRLAYAVDHADEFRSLRR